MVYLQYARAAFCMNSALERWDCGDACDSVPVVSGSVRPLGPSEKYSVKAYVAQRPTHDGDLTRCIIAFRGSVDIMNWVADTKFVPTPWPSNTSSWCPGCQVHQGFAEAFEDLRQSLTTAIRELGCEALEFSGHSLGAALASLSALYFREELGLQVGPIYTFGKPRVGNRQYAFAFIDSGVTHGVKPPMWRVVHYHDIVPRIPPPALAYGNYSHETMEVYYIDRDSSTFRECPPGKGTGGVVNGFENPTCMWATSASHCINFDHEVYLNKTMWHTQMDEKCIGKNVVVEPERSVGQASIFV